MTVWMCDVTVYCVSICLLLLRKVRALGATTRCCVCVLCYVCCVLRAACCVLRAVSMCCVLCAVSVRCVCELRWAEWGGTVCCVVLLCLVGGQRVGGVGGWGSTV